jgi:hypothetical protein
MRRRCHRPVGVIGGGWIGAAVVDDGALLEFSTGDAVARAQSSGQDRKMTQGERKRAKKKKR